MVENIIEMAAADGLEFFIEERRLKAKAPAQIMDKWREEIRANRGGIIKEIRKRNRTADQFSPEERVKWCLACELAHPGSQCPTNKKNEGCGLWSAINHRRPLPLV